MPNNKIKTYRENALLEKYVGTVQHCSGTISTVSIIENGAKNVQDKQFAILLRNVSVGDEQISHKWLREITEIVQSPIAYGCRVEFDAIIVPYENDYAKYSFTQLSNISIVEEGCNSRLRTHTISIVEPISATCTFSKHLKNTEKKGNRDPSRWFQKEYNCQLPLRFKAVINNDFEIQDDVSSITFTHSFRNKTNFNVVFCLNWHKRITIDSKYVAHIDDCSYDRFISLYFFEHHIKYLREQITTSPRVENDENDKVVVEDQKAQSGADTTRVGYGTVTGVLLTNFCKTNNRYGFIVKLSDMCFESGEKIEEMYVLYTKDMGSINLSCGCLLKFTVKPKEKSTRAKKSNKFTLKNFELIQDGDNDGLHQIKARTQGDFCAIDDSLDSHCVVKKSDISNLDLQFQQKINWNGNDVILLNGITQSGEVVDVMFKPNKRGGVVVNEEYWIAVDAKTYERLVSLFFFECYSVEKCAREQKRRENARMKKDKNVEADGHVEAKPNDGVEAVESTAECEQISIEYGKNKTMIDLKTLNKLQTQLRGQKMEEVLLETIISYVLSYVPEDNRTWECLYHMVERAAFDNVIANKPGTVAMCKFDEIIESVPYNDRSASAYRLFKIMAPKRDCRDAAVANVLIAIRPYIYKELDFGLSNS